MDAEGFMKLKAIKHMFHQQLDELYGANEVDSFFKLLLEHHLNLNSIDLVLKPDITIKKDAYNSFLDALNRLKLEEPIQYILGETEFFGLPFKVNTDTLIPRPETEELVQWILDHGLLNQSVLDIGTGTGCIAIALAKNFKKAHVHALDISAKALMIAKANAIKNSVDIKFIEADILNFPNTELDLVSQQFDIIVSNPPYVRELEKSQIKNNVLKHEPHLALFVENDDPLQFYKVISEFAVHKLKPKGLLFFEINQYLGKEIQLLLKKLHFESIELKKDMFGNDRMIKAIKP
jgi:release factor glutamine methyltransferase